LPIACPIRCITNVIVARLNSGPLETTMKFMLMVCRDESAFGDGRSSGEHSKPYVDFARAMSEAGILVSGHRPQPSAMTVRVRNDRTGMSQGHHAQAPEQLGGFYVIDVPNTEEAKRWAARCPGARQGAIEMRAIWE
jgi:hypothetical protein